jgi:hypothetical protein
MTYAALTQTQVRSRPVPSTQWSEVTSLWRSQPWVADASRTMARMSALSENWDGQGSPAPARTVLNVMNRLFKEIDAYDLPTAHIGPVLGGGLGIEWRNGDRDLSLEILPDGSIEYLKAEKTPLGFDTDHMEDGEVPNDRLGEVRALIRWLSGN